MPWQDWILGVVVTWLVAWQCDGSHERACACAQVILYSFPAICWLYGAGILFSSFVSIVFWGASVQQLVESVRKSSTIVRPMGLRVSDTS